MPLSISFSALLYLLLILLFFFFFNDTATTEIYTLSLHDALPIFPAPRRAGESRAPPPGVSPGRSEEHTSELQSRQYLVCRLLLEKKKKQITHQYKYQNKQKKKKKQKKHNNR